MWNRSRTIAAGIFLIGLFSLILIKTGKHDQEDLEKQEKVIVDEKKGAVQSEPTVKTVPQKKGDDVLVKKSSETHRKRQPSKKGHESLWREFSGKFGNNLRPEFAPSGRLVAIRGALGRGSFGSPDFKPDDPQMVRARAQEIIAAAEDLLRIRREMPLENSSVTGSRVSAHVYYKETVQGIPLDPVGDIKIDLGSNGELIALYSDYAEEVNLQNEFSLTPDQVRERTSTKMTELIPNAAKEKVSEGSSLQGGSKLIWVNGEKGYSAYRFFAHGREIIVDAKSAEVLSNRDRRLF